MATRFYFPLDTAAAVSPTVSSEWEHVEATPVRRKIVTSADSSTLTTVLIAYDGADDAVDKDALWRQYVSDPIPAQTIPVQTVSAQFQILEAHVANNLFLTIKIFVCSQDGATIKETLLAITRDDQEPGTSLINRSFTATTSAANVEANDRIVVEIGLGGTPGSGGGTQGHNGSVRFGCNASSGDLPVDDTQTGTTYRPWLEFADSSLFATPVAPGTISSTAVVPSISHVRLTVAPNAIASTSSAKNPSIPSFVFPATISGASAAQSPSITRQILPASVASTASVPNPTIGSSQLTITPNSITAGSSVPSITAITKTYTCEVSLSDQGDPQASFGHVVSYRYQKSATGGQVADLTVGLYQGSTLIASWTHQNIDVGWTTAGQTLSGGQADSITDYSDLRLRFAATISPVGATRSVQVNWAQLALPESTGITPNFISSTATAFGPSLRLTIVLGTITAGAAAQSPSVAFIAKPAFISSVASVPGVTLRLTVSPNAISSAAAINGPAIRVTVLPGTISSASTAYAPSATYVAKPDTIASVATVPAVSGIRITVAPDTISSGALALGPTVTAGTAVIPATIASTASVPAIANITITALPNAIASSSTVPAPALRVSLAPDNVASTSIARSPATSYVAGPNAITSGATVYQPTIGGTATVVPDYIASASSAYNPAVIPSGSIAPNSVASTSSVYGPSLRLTVSPALVASGSTAYGPSLPVVPGTVASTSVARDPTVTSTSTVSPGSIASGSSVYGPTLRLTVIPSNISSSAAANAPSVTAVAAPDTISSSATAAGPSLTYVAKPNVIASGSAVHEPTLGSGITPNTIGSVAAVGSPTLRVTVAPDGVAAASIARAPSIFTSSGVSPAYIASTSGVSDVALVYDQLLGPTVIPSGATVPPPFYVGYATVAIFPNGIASAAAVHNPAMFRSPFTSREATQNIVFLGSLMHYVDVMFYPDQAEQDVVFYAGNAKTVDLALEA